MKKYRSCRSGFTLVEIMIVVTIIGLLASICVPSFVRARTTSQTQSCINNIRQLDAAKERWALDTKQPPEAHPVFDDIKGYLRQSITCPAGGSGVTFDASYNLNDLNSRPDCKLFPSAHVWSGPP